MSYAKVPSDEPNAAGGSSSRPRSPNSGNNGAGAAGPSSASSSRSASSESPSRPRSHHHHAKDSNAGLPTSNGADHSSSSSSIGGSASRALRAIDVSAFPDLTSSMGARTAWVALAGAFVSVCFLASIFAPGEGTTRGGYWGSQAGHGPEVVWKGNVSAISDYKYQGLPAIGSSGKSGEEGFQESLRRINERWPMPKSGQLNEGRHNYTYYSPFNPDDLTMTEERCDATFPGLWKEIDRSVEFFSTKQKFDKEYLEYSCDDGIWTHARVVIYDNRLYLKYYQQSDFTRSQAALALLYLAVSTSREKLPNVEFCMGMMDWGSRGKFSLDRSPDLEDVWLMPDYGWFSWTEHVGAYTQYREQTANIEREIGWEGKKDSLFWRGSMKVGTADRESLANVATGHDWSDIKAVSWDKPEAAVSMADHCRWKYHGFPEGNTYSGRLRYLQNCRSVIVTHEPRWLQHWTHLYNADWDSPEQNIVFIPKAVGEGQGVMVHDGEGKVSYDRTWERLPEVMDALLADDERAKRIANNQWNFFRERYISPASAVCYWRKLLWGFSKVQQYTVDLSGNEKSYEGFLLKGMLKDPHAL